MCPYYCTLSLQSCQPITATVEVNDHLRGLDLADSADGSSCLPVDILIGCDYYWDLVTGSICRGALPFTRNWAGFFCSHIIL